MPVLTPFGIAIRKLRLDKGMRLLDLASKLGLSIAFISAVETGRKPIPDGYAKAIARAMDLTAAEIRELRRAVDRTRKEVRVEGLPEEQRELVAAFARRLDELPRDLMAQIKKVVLKSSSEEIPFERKRRGMLVPPLSTPAIRDFADKVRTAFVEDTAIEFPIMDVLEFRMGFVFDGFFLDVQDQTTMGQDEGRVVPGNNCVVLRSDVYERAWKGNGRDRFTACHELGHYMMHRTVTMARTRDDTDKIYCDAEWQADTFAGTLLFSPRHTYLFGGPEEAAAACRMTPHAASVQWAKYQTEGRFDAPPQIPGL
jgi:transcriptional regulator with XRE-family HTH domain